VDSKGFGSESLVGRQCLILLEKNDPTSGFQATSLAPPRKIKNSFISTFSDLIIQCKVERFGFASTHLHQSYDIHCSAQSLSICWRMSFLLFSSDVAVCEYAW
jgi:hypothetical protein